MKPQNKNNKVQGISFANNMQVKLKNQFSVKNKLITDTLKYRQIYTQISLEAIQY